MHTNDRLLFEQSLGFSILELMIVITIISIIAAWSYPNYIRHIQRTECRVGQLALHQLASRMEHYATLHGNYLGVNSNNMNIHQLEQQSRYRFIIKELKAHEFTLMATSNQDVKSDQCRVLTLTNTQTHIKS